MAQVAPNLGDMIVPTSNEELNNDAYEPMAPPQMPAPPVQGECNESLSNAEAARPDWHSSRRSSAQSRRMQSGVLAPQRPSQVEKTERMLMKSAAQVVSSKKSAKISQRVAMLATVVAVLTVCTMLGTVILGNEVSKEVKAESASHELRDRGGNLINVGTAVSYSTLLDLPAFNTETLSHLKQLTLVLTPRGASGTSKPTAKVFDATLNIVSAIKLRSGTSCTLLGSSGAKVTIDSKAQSAFALIDGTHYVVRNTESASARERRLGEVSAAVFFGSCPASSHMRTAPLISRPLPSVACACSMLTSSSRRNTASAWSTTVQETWSVAV